MKLYLVRHGEAASAGPGGPRLLTEKGRDDVRVVGRRLRESGVRVGRILHSEKERAQETASLLAEAVGDGAGIEPAPGLLPLDPVDPVAYDASGWEEDTMLVGHLPFMPRLVSRLTTGDEERVPTVFRQGTVACLVRTGEGAWGLAWLLPPDLA